MPVKPVTVRPEPVAPWRFRAWELLSPRLPEWVIRVFAPLGQRLPLGSRARRWWVSGAAALVFDATGRSRYDLILPVVDPAVEWHSDMVFRSLGFDEVYRGHEGVRRWVENWNTIWIQPSFTVREILDGGDTWLVRVTGSGRGLHSGAPVTREFSAVARLDPRSHLLVDYHVFVDDADAQREAGFAPPARDA